MIYFFGQAVPTVLTGIPQLGWHTVTAARRGSLRHMDHDMCGQGVAGLPCECCGDVLEGWGHDCVGIGGAPVAQRACSEADGTMCDNALSD